MEKLTFGEVAVLEDGKEYICFNETELNGESYVYLMTNSKPLEVRFAKQSINDSGELELEIVEEQDKKEQLLKMFQEINK